MPADPAMKEVRPCWNCGGTYPHFTTACSLPLVIDRLRRDLQTAQETLDSTRAALARAEGHSRDHHLEACESCAVTESELLAAEALRDQYLKNYAAASDSRDAAEALSERRRVALERIIGIVGGDECDPGHSSDITDAECDEWMLECIDGVARSALTAEGEGKPANGTSKEVGSG